VSQIGWDELLKTRSYVFVMEEEYRMQKAQGDIHQIVASTNGHPEETSDGDAGQVVIHEDGTALPRVRDSLTSEGTPVDDNASTRGIVSPQSTESLHRSSSADINGSLDTPNIIPTIRISSESDRDAEESVTEDSPSAVNGGTKHNGVTQLEKPVQAAAGEVEQEGGEQSPLPAQEPFSFSNKRLCERWLDNLFMVLYEVTYPTSRASSVRN
jgi:hypothetical protein